MFDRFLNWKKCCKFFGEPTNILIWNLKSLILVKAYLQVVSETLQKSAQNQLQFCSVKRLKNICKFSACVCPYCLKIHSRRDNARVHIKNHHKDYPVRDFIKDIDASLAEVRRANETGKCEWFGIYVKIQLKESRREYEIRNTILKIWR